MSGQSVEAACEGKRTYFTWTAAEQVLRRMNRKGKSQSNGRLNVYRCRYCQKFHVGTR